MQASLHRQRGMQRALRVILERRRRAEHRHDRVSCELLDGPACDLDLRGHRVVEAVEHRPRPFGILRRAELSRPDEIGEDDRGELPFAFVRSRLQGRCTGRTEPRRLGHGRAAGGA